MRYRLISPCRDTNSFEGLVNELLNPGLLATYIEGARWRDTGARSSSWLDGRKVRTPRARTLDNVQAERSDTSTTENRPPMAGAINLG